MSYYKLKPTKPINNIGTSNFHSTIMNNKLGTHKWHSYYYQLSLNQTERNLG